MFDFLVFRFVSGQSLKGIFATLLIFKHEMMHASRTFYLSFLAIICSHDHSLITVFNRGFYIRIKCRKTVNY